MNFYNEIDPYCCDWLENLIRAKIIPDGVVDRRSIVDILPAELERFTQCHFFAGLGGWPLALRLAAYPDHKPVWTGSCPCQPFSTAGKRLGFADDRHLWPWWRYLIAVCRPSTILGEQVASASAWLRLVRGDLEALEYAVGCMPVEAASAGADHLRDRFWFVAHDEHEGEGRRRVQRSGEGNGADAVRASGEPAGSGHNGVALGDACVEGLAQRECDSGIQREALGTFARQDSADAGHPFDMGNPVGAGAGRDGASSFGAQAPLGSQRQFDGNFRNAFEPSGSGTLANGNGERQPQRAQHDGGPQSGIEPPFRNDAERSGRTDYEWVLGADGKARRVKSGIRLLAHGVPSRVAKLRAFGNAIDPRPAAAFVKAALIY